MEVAAWELITVNNNITPQASMQICVAADYAPIVGAKRQEPVKPKYTPKPQVSANIIIFWGNYDFYLVKEHA
jgi:hypothetical protein